jgi:hypothetical protein
MCRHDWEGHVKMYETLRRLVAEPGMARVPVSCQPRTKKTKQESAQGLATAMTQLPSPKLREVALKQMKNLLALLAPHPRLVSHHLSTSFIFIFFSSLLLPSTLFHARAAGV